MENTSHQHYFVFNDDGFEVCFLCGLCTSQKEMRHDFTEKYQDIPKFTNFSDILQNNNIGYISEIEKEYLMIKTIIKRGFPNIVLYAYCTYNVLMENFVYYSLYQISIMFLFYVLQYLFYVLQYIERTRQGLIRK